MRKVDMFLRKVLNLLIALAVAAGLLAAPLSVPAMAASQMAAVAHDMQTMAADMPCCPDKQDHKARDCGSCPFVALCMLTITMPSPNGSGVLFERAFSLGIFALPDDLLVDGAGEHPPEHPPRMIV